MAVLAFPGRFARAIVEVRRNHPLPIELARGRETGRHLLEKVEACSEEEFAALLDNLPLSDRQSIFPALACPGGHAEDRLTALAVRYAGWSLYESGWTSLQLAWPHRGMQDALAAVSRELSQDVDPAARPPYLLSPIPESISLALSDEDFIRSAVKLLQSDMEQWPGRSFDENCLYRHVVAESAFGARVLTAFLRQCRDTELPHWQPEIRRILPYMDPADFSALIARLLNSPDLPDAERSSLLRDLPRGFTSEDRRSLVLSQLTSNLRKSYRSWTVLDALSTHYRAYPVKLGTMSRYSDHIISAESPTPLTAFWHFPGFVIADKLNIPDKSYCYPRELFELITRRKFDPDDLSEPKFPCRRISDPHDSSRVNGVVELSFVGGSLKSTEEFLKLKIEQKPVKR